MIVLFTKVCILTNSIFNIRATKRVKVRRYLCINTERQ